MSVSFNDPGDDIGTEISYEMHLVGRHYNEFKTHMNQYIGCFDPEEKRLADADFNSEDNVHLMVEFVIGKFKGVEDKLEEIEALFYHKMAKI